MSTSQFASGLSRRAFLSRVGMGFGALALDAMLVRDGHRASAAAVPSGVAHIAPKAKSVIWLFMIGGTSHLETFDHKPTLNTYAGKTIEETPHKDVLTASYLSENLRVVVPNDANGQMRSTLYPLQVGFKKHGECGIEVSDWLPQLATCVDDLAVVRSMWTTDNNHGRSTAVSHGSAQPRRQLPHGRLVDSLRPGEPQ